MTKQIKKQTKTAKIEIRCTPAFKEMAEGKADKSPFPDVSKWVTKLIQRAR